MFLFVLEIDLALHIYTRLTVLKMFELIEPAFPFRELQNEIGNVPCAVVSHRFIFRYFALIANAVENWNHTRAVLTI